MADALEVFRQHALEVQRLNLVEMLAEEVRAKNVELEGVLSDLQPRAGPGGPPGESLRPSAS